MEFEFQDCIYVEEYYLNEMCDIAKSGGSIMDAITEVSAGWDDCDWYRVEHIRDQLFEEIKRRLAQEKIEAKD